jgi:hypothetical protein
VVRADLVPGIVATDEDPGESVAFARDLAEFIDRSAPSTRVAGRLVGTLEAAT